MNRIPPSILFVDRPSVAFATYRGGLHQYRIVISKDQEHSVVRTWTVLSNGKRSKLKSYILGKLLWDELSKVEWEVVWNNPSILRDTTLFLLLKARNQGISRKILRRNLALLHQFTKMNFITRQQYLGMKGQFRAFIVDEQHQVVPTKKYSGYTKHYKDKGSLRPYRDEISEKIIDSTNEVSEEILFSLLTSREERLSLPNDFSIGFESDTNILSGVVFNHLSSLR